MPKAYSLNLRERVARFGLHHLSRFRSWRRTRADRQAILLRV